MAERDASETRSTDGATLRQAEAASGANREMYRSGARVASYQESAYHLKRLEVLGTALEQALDPRSKPRVLELGAGTPAFSLTMSRRGYDVLATDADPVVVEALAAAGLASMVVDVDHELPFEDETFDVVVMGELIEHIFDTGRLLASCRRVLRRGGVLALTTPNLTTIQDRLRFVIGNSPRQVSPLHEYLRLHIRPFCFQSLRDALETFSFFEVMCRSNYVVWRGSGESQVRFRFLARWFPTLGGSLIVTARKVQA